MAASDAGDAGETLRAFVALDLDAASLRRMARLAETLRREGAEARSDAKAERPGREDRGAAVDRGSRAAAAWVPADKMHVTIKFVASLRAEAVVPIGKALGAMARRPAPMPCEVRLTAFPSEGRARVAVAELVDATGALAKLAAKVDALAEKHGVARETRPYRPHVTLARLKSEMDARAWLQPDLAAAAGACAFEALTLYRSRLGRGGATYVPLARFAFAPRAAR